MLYSPAVKSMTILFCQPPSMDDTIMRLSNPQRALIPKTTKGLRMIHAQEDTSRILRTEISSIKA